MQIWFGWRRLEENLFWTGCGPAVLAGYAACLLWAPSVQAAGTAVELSPLVAKSTLLAPLDGNHEIGVVLALPLSDPAGAAEYIERISQKGDPLYHHYLTPQQFAERFGGDAKDYSFLKEWAITNGLRISQESLGRLNLTVRGSVSQWQRIFSTQINRFRAPDGSEFYSASVQPTVPPAIASKISGVIGLTGGKQYAPLVRVGRRLGESSVADSRGGSKTASAGSGPGGTYSAKDLRLAYSVPTFGNLSDNGVVAVFEQGGFTVSDVTEYLDTNDLPHVKVTPVSVDNSPTTVSDPNVELEAVLDIDMVIGINPSVDEVRVYEDSIDTFQTALLDAITQVGDENKAQVLSISYGQDEGYQGKDAIAAENKALQQLAIEGITVTASSGDNGAYGDGYSSPYNVSDPASQPYITGVGGTALYTGPGHAYVDEQAWNELASGLGATGGGVSSYWPIPSYQSNLESAFPKYITGNGGSSKMRNVPDVAAVGDPLTGVGIYSQINGGWVLVGGTSASSPIWAGYLSAINAVFNYTGLQNLGFLNPALYAVGTSAGLADPSSDLYDITVGSNGDAALFSGYPGYSNGLYYSNTTGNGSLWGGGFAAQLLISGTASGTAPGAISDFGAAKTTNNAITLKWTAARGASGYVLGLYYNGVYGYNVEQSFVTKDTNITIPGLNPGITYWVYIWAFNGSGGSQPVGPYNFFLPQKLSDGSGAEQKILLLSPNPNTGYPGPGLGSAIALDGKTLAIGAPDLTINGQSDVGETYVYLEPAQGWGSDQVPKVIGLTASDGLTQQYPMFGQAVGVSGDTIVVGSAMETYVYVRPSAGWTTATENAQLEPPSGYRFGGHGVAVDGDTIVVQCVNTANSNAQLGAGAVYIKPLGGWAGKVKSVAVLTDGQTNDALGGLIAITGDTIAMTAEGATVSGINDAGDVQVYEKPAGGWTTTATPTATLVASDPELNGFLGTGFGLSGDTIVATVPVASVDGVPNGAAYVFVRDGLHWSSKTETARLTAIIQPSWVGYAVFGQSAAIHGDTIVVGANGATSPDGAVYGGELFFYQRPSGGWRSTSTEDGILYNPYAQGSDQLGISTAIQNGTIVGGQVNSEADNNDSGEVVIFRPHANP